MKIKKDKIIVLKIAKYSDDHLIVTGLTPNGSKLTLMAPAALKSRKRFGGGVLEPTHFIDIQYEQKFSDPDKLPILKDAQLIESFEGLRTDYDKLNLAFYFLKIVEQTTKDEMPDSDKVFSLIGHALKSLEKAKDIASFRMHFEIKYLYTQGVLEIKPGIDKYLRSKFSDYIHIPSDFETSFEYQNIKSNLEEYTGVRMNQGVR